MILEEKHFEELYFQNLPMPKCCFLCGKRLTVPFFFWNGTPPSGRLDEFGHLALHLPCAREMVDRIEEDVWVPE